VREMKHIYFKPWEWSLFPRALMEMETRVVVLFYSQRTLQLLADILPF